MKITIKGKEISLVKSKKYPACWEYKLGDTKFVITPYELRNNYHPYDMSPKEEDEFRRICLNSAYSKNFIESLHSGQPIYIVK